MRFWGTPGKAARHSVRMSAAPCGPFGRFASLAATLRFAPAHFRLRRIPAGRRVRMRRGLPSPGSVGIPPVAGSAASRLPPSASPAVTASASCRRTSCPLRPSLARGKGEGRTLRAITNQRAHFAHCKGRGTRTAETDKCRQRARGEACLPRGQSESGAARGKTPPGRMRLAQGGFATKPSAP